jgi:hypothetical protein
MAVREAMSDVGCFVRPGALWLDTARSPIRAHSGTVIQHRGTWYWYGADHYRASNVTVRAANSSANRMINVYSSKNLCAWDLRGVAFELRCTSRAVGCYVDRPRILFDQASGRFILWMKSTPFLAVAHSVSPVGPFTSVARWLPDGPSTAIGDIGAFIDPVSQQVQQCVACMSWCSVSARCPSSCPGLFDIFCACGPWRQSSWSSRPQQRRQWPSRPSGCADHRPPKPQSRGLCHPFCQRGASALL